MSAPGQQDEDGLLWFLVQAANGQPYALHEVAEDAIAAMDGNLIAVDVQDEGAVLVRREEPPGLFRVHGASLTTGAFGSMSDVEGFALAGYHRLVVIPARVFRHGQPAAEGTSPLSEIFQPTIGPWQAVPGASWAEANDDVALAVIHGKRFARLTAAGESKRRAADEAARQARNKREAADAATARAALEEAERIAAEVRHSQELAAREAWLASLPPRFGPGAHNLNIRNEINSRLGQVEYVGVQLATDGQYKFSGAADELPKTGRVVFGGHPSRDQIFHLDHIQQDWLDQFVPYEGSARPIGTRVPRAEALNGRDDPFPPQWGDCVIARFDFVGQEFSSGIGEDFSIDAAIDFLSEKSPNRMVTVSIAEDETQDSDVDSDYDRKPGLRVARRQVSQTLAERYRYLFDHLGRKRPGLYVRWTEHEWENHDRRLLEAEERCRLDSNAAWSRRKSGLIHFMKVLGAFTNDDSNVFWEGASCALVLPEVEADKLDAFLRHECKCDVQMLADRYEPEAGFVERHSAIPGRFDVLVGHWRKCGGSIQRFVGGTLWMAPDGGAIQFPVEGLIQEGMVTLFVGPAKLGKSTLGLNLAICFATGRPFGGLAVKRSGAAYLFGEGSKATFRAQLVAAEYKDAELEIIDARDYDADLDRALDLALDDLAKSAGLGLLVVDSAEAFVLNATDGTAVTKFYNKLDAFAGKTGVAVVLIHHGTKDLTADNATSAKAVFDKIKGAGTFVNRSRAVITLHRHGDRRVMTLYKDNIPEFTPKLRNALEFEIDPKTGLCRNATTPIVAAGSIPPPSPSVIEGSTLEGDDADAGTIAAVVHRLEKALGRPVPKAGPKSPFHAKAPELVGWSRLRCERAHRHAVDLKLCKAAHPKKRALQARH